MPKYEYRFKKHGGGGWIKIEIDEDGTMNIPETSFRDSVSAMRGIQSAVNRLIKENWVEARIKVIN